MRAVVMRCSRAAVRVEGRTVGEIGPGFVVLLGVAADDGPADLDYLVPKIAGLRVFSDEGGRFNRSLEEVGGSVLVVSQFTLYGDCRHGRRPSFTRAAPGERARKLYEEFVERLRATGLPVATGEFGARMMVEIFNDGPVTLLLDSRKEF
ncbi:MAG: D-aminoacyl-tRNA deacylase [Desulfotomaculales bacterium]